MGSDRYWEKVERRWGVTTESLQVSTKLSTHVRPYIEDIRANLSNALACASATDGNRETCRDIIEQAQSEFERLVMLLASGKCYE